MKITRCNFIKGAVGVFAGLIAGKAVAEGKGDTSISFDVEPKDVQGIHYQIPDGWSTQIAGERLFPGDCLTIRSDGKAYKYSESDNCEIIWGGSSPGWKTNLRRYRYIIKCLQYQSTEILVIAENPLMESIEYERLLDLLCVRYTRRGNTIAFNNCSLIKFTE